MDIKELISNASKSYWDMWEQFYKPNSVEGYIGLDVPTIQDDAVYYINHAIDRATYFDPITELAFDTVSDWLIFKLIHKEINVTNERRMAMPLERSKRVR